MFATPAFAQAAGAAASGGGPQDLIMQFAPLLFIGVMGYFLLLRPQQKRAKDQRALIEAIKRGDTVVLNSGVIGKVSRVDDAEVQVEIATGVVIKVVKAMISDVRTRGEPAAANDAKSTDAKSKA
ncbi:preprotein translocase subunit YajC [Caulobacter sp. S45]|uniref:preprotein translocase subunit YajC n=1 Tax=Caulobacter sp. S45 TaxID=1641861 RepID=UPI001574FB33|nr:preprotein translocase subunit YajC [Caulobacter sp. S45]